MKVLSRILALAGLALAAGPADAGMRYGELEFAPCVLGEGLPLPPAAARCATLEVPEDPWQPEGSRRIALALAWVPATGRAEPEPVFFIAGGPGQSAREAFPSLLPAFAELNRSRDLFFLDQRGTGGSHRLDCPEPTPAFESFAAGEALRARAREYAAACREALAGRADLRRYGTREAVADLEAVRGRLGAERIVLIGVSYGTRVAQEYARAHPARTAALVLDGVVPPTRVFANEVAANLEAALNRLFERCRADASCVERLGDPGELLARARARLEAGGLPAIRFRDPTTGEGREQALDYPSFAGLLRMYAYHPLGMSLIPYLLREVAHGEDGTALALDVLLERELNRQMALGMQLSVLCTEDADAFAPRPGDEGTLLGTTFVEILASLCAEWPKGEPEPRRREPLAGDFPALLLSGEFDPVTPPAYGEEAMARLSRARHLVLPGQGHNVLAAGCLPKLLAQFLERGEAASLDASCLERLAPLPILSAPYGWEP
ncbi:MAG: alpha/beta hydrolase [Xanthomonadales bacterium]|nr:alpha/beta hydrolase [Xanthomonadales bacterium]